MSRIPARHSRNRVRSAASSRWSPPRTKGSLSRSLRGSTSGNWLMLHPPLGRGRVIVLIIVLAPHCSEFAILRLLALLLLDKLVDRQLIDPSCQVGQGARLMVGVALADRLIDGGFVAFVGFARVVLRAIAGQIAAMSLG